MFCYINVIDLLYSEYFYKIYLCIFEVKKLKEMNEIKMQLYNYSSRFLKINFNFLIPHILWPVFLKIIVT